MILKLHTSHEEWGGGGGGGTQNMVLKKIYHKIVHSIITAQESPESSSKFLCILRKRKY
jgi:hypothetical protein